MKTTVDIGLAFERFGKSVYRLCYSYLGQAQDAEDATQSTFMKLLTSPREFASDEHLKAWLLACAANHCKDVLKSAARSRSAEMPPDVADTHADEQARVEPSPVEQAILALPDRYKDCVYLYYYEGYKTAEIAQLTGKPPSTVRNDLSDARKMLKTLLEGN